MAKALDLKKFFRRVPHEWLRRYFESKRLLQDFGWASITKRNIDPLLKHWQTLERSALESTVSEFQQIELLATPAGKVQFIDEAAYHEEKYPGLRQAVTAKMLELGDFYACAFWVLLEHPICWNGALRYAIADGKHKTYWRKRIKMPKLGRLPTDDDACRLATALSKYFQQNQGRGHACVVHAYRRGVDAKREYFFAYPEDHRHTPLVFDAGELVAQPHNPAFEIIFVLDDEQQSLNIWYEGTAEQVKELQVLFARVVLRTSIERNSPRDERVYNLKRFLDPDFTFSPDPVLGIENVELRTIRLKVGGRDAVTVLVDLYRDTPKHALHQRVSAAITGIANTEIEVTLVRLRVIFNLLPGQTNKKCREFRIVTPNSCSLKIDEFSPLIEHMLIEHGIEPRPPMGVA